MKSAVVYLLMGLVLGQVSASLICGSGLVTSAAAQSPADKLPSVSPNPDTKNKLPDPSELIPWKQVIQLGLLMFIGTASLVVQCIMLSRAHATADDIIKGGALILIITLSVSALIFGFDDKQIAPVVGLFGTIIGFLLGKVDNRGVARNAPAQGQDGTDVHPGEPTPPRSGADP